MPELPEVETIRCALRPFIEGQRIVSARIARADLRVPFPPDFVRRLEGRRVETVERRAKYMIWRLDDGAALLIHLGMSGTIIMGNADAKHDHASFLFENGERATYRDPRRFGMMDLAQQSALTEHPSLARLGPEPLGRDFNATILEKAAQRRRQPVKTALLDQTFVAGLGNIYVCEALFQAGVSPFRPTSSLARAECKKLAAAVKDVLRRAIRAGGSTLKDHRRPSGETGYFQHSFAVYGRTGEPCPRCGGEARIERALQAGRPTFHCPACQR